MIINRSELQILVGGTTPLPDILYRVGGACMEWAEQHLD